jgi:hypothetical protein
VLQLSLSSLLSVAFSGDLESAYFYEQVRETEVMMGMYLTDPVLDKT